MARRTCLSIGVATVQPLNGQAMTFGYLDGAIPAAEAIGKWALQSGFGAENVQIVTDAGGKAVTEQRVREAVRALFPPGGEPVSHMVLSFIGHGLTDAHVGSMSWLFTDAILEKYRILSDAFYDELLYYGIDRLTVLADACREAPDSLDLLRLEARRGIAVHGEKASITKVDRLSSCQDGELGYMVTEPASANPGKCIFSGVIADVLWGREPEAIRDGRITVAGFASHVRRRTAQRAKDYKLKLSPQCSVDPEEAVLYDAASPPAGDPQLQPWPSTAEATALSVNVTETVKRVAFEAFTEIQRKPAGRRKVTVAAELDRFGMSKPASLPRHSKKVLEELVVLREAAVPASKKHRENQIRQRVGQLQVDAAEKARDNTAQRLRRRLAQAADQLGAGLNLLVIGEVVRIWAQDPVKLVSGENGRSGFRIDPALDGTQMLVEFGDGSFVPHVPYDKAASVVLRDRSEEVFQVYGMSPGLSASFGEALRLTTRFASGRLGPEDIKSIAVSLRKGKHSNPLQGVLAAYLYRAAADIASIRKMAFLYADRGQAVPFDIALLGDLAAKRSGSGELRLEIPAVPARQEAGEGLPDYVKRATPAARASVGGLCPWIGLGWDYVGLARAQAWELVERIVPCGQDVPRIGFTVLSEAAGRKLVADWNLHEAYSAL
ncbi:hypothetical protein FMN50_04860 [Rhodobacterales bacterium]|nr:hypothetical protein FMN50_04860 [Rhodobacterales bacterium]